MDILQQSPGVALQCGWGRLLFADTFPEPEAIADAVLNEHPEQRDIALYIKDPHLVLNCAPQQIFLDPSNTYRLRLAECPEPKRPLSGVRIRPLEHKEELDEINRIYTTLGMVPLQSDLVWKNRDARQFTYAIAEQSETGKILGVAMGADHRACGESLPNLCSVWAVAVDPQAALPGIGEGLVRFFIDLFQKRGRTHMDVSVVHDNTKALRLYEKLGFKRIDAFAAKRRNRINESLFIGSPEFDDYNPYATIIIKEALRRGIAVEPTFPARGHFRLSLGGRRVNCWESLSEMTSALALKRTDDKQFTREILHQAGLRTPDQILAGKRVDNLRFLNRHKSVVIKPLQGEQGQGISVDVRSEEGLDTAIGKARDFSETILIEQFIDGDDLRIIVINKEVVAAAVRRPPTVIGTGEHTIRDLIERLSRRRSAATGGESSIPVDSETERCISHCGYAMEDVLEKEVPLTVRKTANLHTGGTMHDVTDQLHPELGKAAVAAAVAVDIPVVGLDFIVTAPDRPEYAIIEANERPGLANHQPQPTAEKFIDFLFPQSITHSHREDATNRHHA